MPTVGSLLVIVFVPVLILVKGLSGRHGRETVMSCRSGGFALRRRPSGSIRW
ncbi:hypothetical protein [Frankia sp. AiPa1]|uniref:hypothetical protein n=1 Tax=Frankia sp. AiPa1 TaxID=573492 RepID=UPI00202B7AF7|nr:hypothetical protein [Frankia sp. AiPa1]MCL9760325.1 hypothetical protein [Frankia sp. AiPa1]